MHRKHLRATVLGVDRDIPIATFTATEYLRFDGTSIITSPVSSSGSITGSGSSTDLAIVRWDGVTGTLIQNSVVLISDVGQVTGVTALNGRDIARWTDGPSIGGVTPDAITLWDGATGRLLKNSTVTITPGGDITPTTIGSIPVGVLVKSSGGSPHAVNTITRWDSGTGHPLKDSTVTLADGGNMTGLGTLNTRTIANWIDGPTPAVSVNGNITVWSGTGGRLAADSGLNIANVVYNLDSEVVSGHLPMFSDSAGRRITDSGIISAHVVTSAAVGTDNSVARYDGALRAIQSSIVVISDTGAITGVATINGFAPGNVRGVSTSVNGQLAAFSGTDGKAIFDTGIGALGGFLTNVVAINGTAPGNWVRGVPSAVNGRLAAFNGTDGKAIYDTNIGALGDSLVNVVNITMSGTLNSRDPDTFTVGPDTAASLSLARYADTTGFLLQDSPVLLSDLGELTGVATINGSNPLNWMTGPASVTNNRLVRFNGPTGKLAKNSVVTLDDTGAMTGVLSVNGVFPSEIVTCQTGSAISDIPYFTDTTGKVISSSGLNVNNIISTAIVGSGTDNAIVRFDGITNKRTQNSLVTIDDLGNMSGVGTLNGITLTNLVTAASTFATDNRILRSDGTARGSQASAVTIDDSGNLTGVGTINGLALADNAYYKSYATVGGFAGTTGFFVFNREIGVAGTPAGTIQILAMIPYVVGDTGSDIQVTLTWTNCAPVVTGIGVGSGIQGGVITTSGATGTLDTSIGQMGTGGIITIAGALSRSNSSVPTFSIFIKSTGTTHTIASGLIIVTHGIQA